MDTKAPEKAFKFKRLEAGDPAPWFRQRSSSNEDYNFDTAAGRYIVMCFFLSAGQPAGQNMLKILSEYRELFNDDKIAFFGVTHDANDEKEKRVAEQMPGIRYFWDIDGKIGKLYGSTPTEMPEGADKITLRPVWFVIDPTMRVRKVFAVKPDGSERHDVAAYLKTLPDVNKYPGFEVQAPVFILPNVFESEFCQHLIDLYLADGGTDSGFMREKDGKTISVTDYGHKRRSDFEIQDEALKTVIQQKVIRRIVPEILKVHQYEVTRMERYLVGCYDSATKGHFRAHRDNTTKGTAHRRFAVSINLNAEFDGGEVSFPEYGMKSFKPPVGGACVFSCSLLHEVSRVTSGKRYAFLPFLYDDAAAKIREQNVGFLESGQYKYS